MVNKNSRNFHWREKCGRWTTSHGTNGHLGPRDKRTPDNASANVAELPLFENASCWVEEDPLLTSWSTIFQFLVWSLVTAFPWYWPTVSGWIGPLWHAMLQLFTWTVSHPLECIAPILVDCRGWVFSDQVPSARAAGAQS